ncbi:hypothetical protein NLJ89_g9519 [Agrocybe chaxingu]|uniref:Uncharacterized protein n=1 Tax=Agrocybe chaxingu TaxID=84603 RepID=A0A9W8MRR4_9AGAR|nr:hypothetical protein NLJ89_g9519 [Agrocybe chaxingu]
MCLAEEERIVEDLRTCRALLNPVLVLGSIWRWPLTNPPTLQIQNELQHKRICLFRFKEDGALRYPCDQGHARTHHRSPRRRTGIASAPTIEPTLFIENELQQRSASSASKKTSIFDIPATKATHELTIARLAEELALHQAAFEEMWTPTPSVGAVSASEIAVPTAAPTTTSGFQAYEQADYAAAHPPRNNTYLVKQHSYITIASLF